MMCIFKFSPKCTHCMYIRVRRFFFFYIVSRHKFHFGGHSFSEFSKILNSARLASEKPCFLILFEFVQSIFKIFENLYDIWVQCSNFFFFSFTTGNPKLKKYGSEKKIKPVRKSPDPGLSDAHRNWIFKKKIAAP